ncbi:MAG: DUF2220 family protein [Methylobacter sp.]|nr:DUF2220 family protein [Methylobacter sp.]MDP2098222.1 DUF2220 family protein [Methylobacter sp.]MDP2426719.1 DUF2220 family protein [Methylobacter sp.]MDP3054731.1 DUF2220 family protein [Methylobacter sp.]MDP3361783.1 DUF2220 family protein [Methylobacter sp.]
MTKVSRWTSPADLRAQLQKSWERGEVLAGLVSDTPLFPKRLTLKTPTSNEMIDRFDEVRVWSAELRKMPHCRVDMREFKHRLFGNNALPQAVWIDTLEDALVLLGKRQEAARFTALVELTRQRQPLLLDWLAKRPLNALALFDVWSRLLDIVAWLEQHPRPGVYLRQVDIAGVHSKFIEAHRGVLTEWLDRVLPPDAVDFSASGVSQFCQRYGFRDKPLRIRFRLLDPACALLPGETVQDMMLDAESFSQLDPNVTRVFITENEINFLAFPPFKRSLVIFGAGYGFDNLSQAQWLARCTVHYWGDIDTHGFAILDQLRSQFEHVQSLLMDRETLLAFTAHWGEEEKQTLRDLPRLNAEEAALYDDLRDNRLGKKLRLEQEKIGFGWLEAALLTLDQ